MPRALRTFAPALLATLALLHSARAQDETTRIDSADPKQPTVSGTPALPPEPVPPAPEGLILDHANVFLPEAAARLSAQLTSARAADVHVYVVTFRTLGVVASKQEEKLRARAKDFIKAWTTKKVGAVVLFDDEGGLMTVELTPETERRFTGFAVEAALREPLGRIQESGLARDKLERSAQAIVETLVPLQAKWVKDTRRQRTSNLIMGAVALLGIGLAIYSAIAKPKAPTLPIPGIKGDSEPPPDF